MNYFLKKFYLCDINRKALNKVRKHPLHNKRIFISEIDASNEIEVIDFFRTIKKKFKKLDALINNVGIAGPTGTIEKLESSEWENTLHVNVTPAAAVEFQHFQNKIIEKINSFFGYKAIHKIKIHHLRYYACQDV